MGEPLEAKRPSTCTGILRRLWGWLGRSLGRELRALALSHTAPVPASVAPPEISSHKVAYTTDCALPHTTNGRWHKYASKAVALACYLYGLFPGMRLTFRM